MTAAPGGRPDPGPGHDRSWIRGRDEVIAALGRLADGTFARCDVCGVQISDRRLRLAPAADRCLNHFSLALQRPSVLSRDGGGPHRPGDHEAHDIDRTDHEEHS